MYLKSDYIISTLSDNTVYGETTNTIEECVENDYLATVDKEESLGLIASLSKWYSPARVEREYFNEDND